MRLSRGIVDAEMPKLFLDPVKIEETLGSDTVYKRELYLASENNLYIKGLAYSSHSRVKILKNAFGGFRKIPVLHEAQRQFHILFRQLHKIIHRF